MIFIQPHKSGTTSTKINAIYFTQKKIINAPVIDSGSSSFDNSISSVDLVKKMKAGWNLGNSLDSHSFSWQENPCQQGLESEVGWDDLYVTKEIIESGKNLGYSTIRIPVTWYNHIIDDEYTIDPDWMARVKTIVDWAYNAGYYVILNEHHSVHGDSETSYKDDGSYDTRAMNSPLEYGDGYIVRNNSTDIKESEKFLIAIWRQIGKAFNNSYGERLIFETMNEPRNTSHGSHTWYPGLSGSWPSGYPFDHTDCEECKKDYEILNQYNQLVLYAIRSTGGNNTKRFVMIPSLCTGLEPALHELFKMPEDLADDKLILTVHLYPFGTSSDESPVTFSDEVKSKCDSLKDLNARYISKGIPVVVGETGVHRKKVDLSEQIKWISYMAGLANDYGMSVVYWDSGADNENTMAQIDRENLSAYQPTFVQAFLSAFN
ncbi:MAG: glycoside hydrolase family 5 protein [Treponema sp.]|nr:glycoside hydrolase family 5 protein [Treponema sp.]